MGMSKEALMEVVQPVFEGEDGKTYSVTALDSMSHAWRQMAAQAVKALDPATYKKYREVKYAGIDKDAGERPSLTQRRKAYLIIVKRFLELSYNIPGC